MVSRSWPNTWWAYFVANGLPVGPWVTTMPRSNRPEQTRRNAMRSRWEGSMLACTLNTKPENGASSGRGTPSTSSRGAGRRHEVDHRVEQLAHAEVGERGAEEDRGRLRGQEGLAVELGAGAVEQVELVAGRGPRGALLDLGPVGGDELLRRLGRAAGDPGEPGEGRVASVDHAAEVAGQADRPGDRRRLEVELLGRARRAARAGRGPVGPTC